MSIVFIVPLLSFLTYLGAYGTLVWLHIKPTEYNPVRNAVSDYGVGYTRRLFNTYLQLNSFGAIALAIALIKIPSVPQRSIIFLFLLICARIGTSMFPTDLEGKTLTRTGFLHYIFAILSVGFVYSIIAQLTPFFQTRPDWQAVSSILNIILTITTPILVMVVVTMWKPLRKFFGLFERIFIATTAVSFLIVSAFLTILFH